MLSTVPRLINNFPDLLNLIGLLSQPTNLTQATDFLQSGFFYVYLLCFFMYTVSYNDHALLNAQRFVDT